MIILAICIGTLALSACSDNEEGSTTPKSDAGLDTDTDSDGGIDFLCNGPWVENGEPCKNDMECNVGLLCNRSTNKCSPIQGITLLDSYYPIGRIAETDDDYSEGLDFKDGNLWQSTPYKLFSLDVKNKEVDRSYPTPSIHGESLTWDQDTLYHVGFYNNNLYAGELIGDDFDFRIVGELTDTACAYGIVEHCGELFVTRCGDIVVDVYPTGTTALDRTFTVRDTNGDLVNDLEDLEIYRGELWTSSYSQHPYTVFRVDLESGTAILSYDIPDCQIIDGAAVDAKTRTMYISGKNCPILVYQVE
ncbi:MAG: glutaminyl-peptide cyclotransferase [Deltaproteobacteria bacterium]|nr:glutaminyl-peptide cyclotransferase [Deltaproteobacteria bacterium]